MKKRNLILTLMLSIICLFTPLVLSGCGQTDDYNNIRFIVEDGYLQYTLDGKTYEKFMPIDELKDTYVTYSNYTITFDYGKAVDLFKTTPSSNSIKSTEWIKDLPEIKDGYKDSFLGWFIQGTEKEIENYDFIGGNVTLEARFDIEKTQLSGLYQNGKYVKTWNDLVAEYPDAIVDNKISGVLKYYYQSIFKSLSGEFVIDSSITSIVKSAFAGCSGLTSITIPSSVTSIGDRVFAGCSGLTSITIPKSVTSIGDRAFDGCSGLTSITIPKSVTSIGDYVFYGCTGLTSITIPNSVASIGNSAFDGCTGLTSITIPESVTSIGDCVFYGCTGLTNITIHSGVTSIGALAFRGCIGLTSITIPDSVTSIGNGSFSKCSGLTSIKVDENNTIYDSRENCNAIIEKSTNILIAGCKNTIIPESVTSIGEYVFYGHTGLTSITIPNSVTSIGSMAFMDCDALTSITIPNSVTSIGTHAFSGCTGLASIKVDENNTVYDSRDNCNAIIQKRTNKLFVGCKNTIIPNSVTLIGENAFEGCTGLTSIIIPNSVTLINAYAFEGCTGLTSITIPNSVTSIGDYVFYGCTGLTSITIPNSVTLIGENAFEGCTGLTSIIIPNSVTSIGNSAFNDCTGLTSVIIESEDIANSLISRGSQGYLIDNADTVYIKTGFDVTDSTYLLQNFTKQETSDKSGYDMYVRK